MFNESRYRTEYSRLRKEYAAKMTGKVLDVGGGVGAYLPYFGSKDVTVIDISQEALDRLDHDKKVLCDACHTPFADNTFDNVWACGVCCFLDIDEFINEARRVGKRGGKIVIELPNPDTPWDKYKKIFGMNIWNNYYKEFETFRMYKISELRKYGNVTGEVRFLPAILDKMIRNKPKYWHTIILEVEI